MKTIIDLPRPLLLRAASLAARKRLPLSRFIAQSVERELDDAPPRQPPSAVDPARPDDSPAATDPLFDSLRGELGL